jgi:hypothetical protein
VVAYFYGLEIYGIWRNVEMWVIDREIGSNMGVKILSPFDTEAQRLDMIVIYFEFNSTIS